MGELIFHYDIPYALEYKRGSSNLLKDLLRGLLIEFLEGGLVLERVLYAVESHFNNYFNGISYFLWKIFG